MGPVAGNFENVRVALGYLAGIIDGEGSISCTSRNMQYWLKKYDLTLNSQDIKKSKGRKILKELGLI
jgi:hypothetical protein